jgi:hypothetical protein
LAPSYAGTYQPCLELLKKCLNWKINFKALEGIYLTLDPVVYTRAKVFGFITKPKRFSIGFMLPFTHAATNPIVNLLGFVPCPETLNPEKIVGTGSKHRIISLRGLKAV